jgi:hypothetical protein
MVCIEEDPAAELRLDLEGLTLDYGDFRIPVAISEAARRALVEGTWDTLTEMLTHLPETRQRAATLPGFGS